MRSTKYEQLLKERRAILEKGYLTDNDNQALTALKKKLGYIPTAETPEDIDAMELIRSMADLLRAKK